MNKLKKLLMFVMIVGILFICDKKVQAITYSASSNIQIFAGTSWSYTMANTDRWIGTVNGNKKGNKYVKDYCTVTISGKTLKITAVAASKLPSNTVKQQVYIYSGNTTGSKAHGVRIITVTIRKGTLPSLAASFITHSTSSSTVTAANNKNGYIYLYKGDSCKIKMNTNGTVDSRIWSYSGTSGGLTISNTGSQETTISTNKNGTYTLTARITTKYSKNGQHSIVDQSLSGSVNIYVIEKPSINFTCNGNIVSSLTLNKGETKAFSYSIGQLNTNATCTVTPKVNDNSNNYISVSNDTSTGNCKVTTKDAFTQNTTAYITLTLIINSGDAVSNTNGAQIINKTIPVKLSNYYQITSVRFYSTEKNVIIGNKLFQNPVIEPADKDVKDGYTWKSSNPSIATVDANGIITTHNIGSSVITATTTDGGNISASYTVNVISTPPSIYQFKESSSGLNVYWNQLNNIASYELYRSSSLNGEYTKIATVKSNFYTDTSALYNKKYYYKISAIPTQGTQYASELSAPKSVQHVLMTPSIKKVKKIGKKRISVTISSTKYDGFIVYMGNKKKTKKAVNIIKGNKCALSIKPKKKKYIRVRAYIMQNNKRIFSSYSKAKKVKIK